MTLPLRVVKVGGSLFTYDPLPQTLRRWLASEPPTVNVLVAGGGPFADAIRLLDARFRLGTESAHWLCVKSLNLTADLLANLLELKRPAADLAELAREIGAAQEAGPVPPTIVFAPESFLYEDARAAPDPLPCDWSVSSDSIAARLAERIGATELVLLKSTEAQAAESEFVDEHFRIAAGRIPQVRFVNLRRLPSS